MPPKTYREARKDAHEFARAKGVQAVSTILGVANYASAANKAYNISRATKANSNK